MRVRVRVRVRARVRVRVRVRVRARVMSRGGTGAKMLEEDLRGVAVGLGVRSWGW